MMQRETLEISMDELPKLGIERDSGKPAAGDYPETELPDDLRKAIREYLEDEQERVPYLDCLWCELYGSINANQWDGRITIEQADYLRGKYLFDTGSEDDE